MENIKREPEEVIVPLKVEVYRVDRFPLHDADVYLNQRFIGRTDEKGVFSTDVNLTTGEFYTLNIEKDKNGYVYGPWETRFKFEEEKKRRRERKELEQTAIESLEGEFDILSELERAQQGKASLTEKYHFLAILDGYMYYTIHVSGKHNAPIRNATVIVNGKIEGKTDERGNITVKYSGDDTRKESVQVFKEGEHMWMNDVVIRPDAEIDVELNKMLLVDVYTLTENYGVITGVSGSDVYIGNDYVGKTGEEGLYFFRYMNEKGVDGHLMLSVKYPSTYLPRRIVRSFMINRDLPKLTVHLFSYLKKPVTPNISVLPLMAGSQKDVLLSRQANILRSRIEDYLSSGGVFNIVPGRKVQDLFQQFNLTFEKQLSWSDIPPIKRVVDGVIAGEMHTTERGIAVKLYGFDYSGEKICEMEKTIALRELQSIPEYFVKQFISNFPFEGNITRVSRKVYINLGKRHGVDLNNKFYSFNTYFDEVKKDFSRKRVARLKIVDAGEVVSAGELETISEGFLLEAGTRVKRFQEPLKVPKKIPVALLVVSDGKPVEGAAVYLDDHWTGKTDESGNLTIVLSEGTYGDVLVFKEGFIPAKIGIQVREDSSSYRVELTQGKASFTISSEPEGALLFIDSVYSGTTPVEKALNVPFGFHLVELKLDGYKDFKQYIKFDTKRLSLTGKEKIKLYRDYYSEATKAYSAGDIRGAISMLESITPDHPDYGMALEFLGFIYLNDIKNFKRAIEYYTRILTPETELYPSSGLLVSWYNLGQAYYNDAEELFYSQPTEAMQDYVLAVKAFGIIKEGKGRIPPAKKKTMYQDSLFYIAVSNQKLYYITGQLEYISRAYHSWIDYFDFFDKNSLSEIYYRNQYSIAQSYWGEAKRLKGE
ncbi:MAG: PEGA domain-containing protein [Spirochaetota bacterium]